MSQADAPETPASVAGIVGHHQPDAPLYLRQLGGKAAALLRLRETGLAIPPWFAVLPEADEPAIRAAAAALAVPADADQGANPDARCLLAVRSSAREEDGATHSFAGQLDSFLSVRAADVMLAVERVRASARSERLLAYRREQGLTGEPGVPTVLVQRMVLADAAGVAFSADPISGRRGVAVVSAVWGLGTALVSGETSADTWLLDRKGTLLREEIVSKPSRHVPAPGSLGLASGDASEGIRVEAVPADVAGRPALDSAEVQAVASLARSAERHFGRPQDIEWAMAGGKLWLLQSRPITSLARMADPDAAPRIWDNANIAESYSGITSPLTFTFARMAYEHVYRGFCALMGVSRDTVEHHGALFANMLGTVRGRVYYNLLNWYRVLALLPGFAVNRKFMEGMMGVREGLPADLTALLEATSGGEKLRDAFRLFGTVLGLLRQYVLLERDIRRFFQRLEKSLGQPVPDLRSDSPEELVAHYRTLERQLLWRWDAPLVNDFFAMIFYGVLKQLTAKWCGDTDGTLQNALLAAQGGIISAEPARRMREIASLLAARPSTIVIFSEGSLDEIEVACRLHPEIGSAISAYVDRFGDRCLGELKLESPTLLDEPLPFYRSVARMAQAGPCAESLGVEQQTKAAERLSRDRLGGHPLRSPLFQWVLHNARRLVANRENLRFERTRVFGRVRRIFAEFGKRLAEAGCLANERDVFFLELHEVLGFAEGTVTTSSLAALARVRRDAYADFARQAPPGNRFETHGAVHIGNPFEEAVNSTDNTSSGEDADRRKGLGACPGVRRGPVRVVRDPAGAQIEAGEILVAERTDPGWILLFPLASGLLVEHGSLLSHSAIVSRELGLPAIVSIPGVTRWLRTGDEVEMDGSSGWVRLTRRAADV